MPGLPRTIGSDSYANRRAPACVFSGEDIDLDFELDPDIRRFMETDYRRVVAAVALVCGGRVAAEDAVQEAVGRAWERLSRGEGIESMTAWITVAATNLARSAIRRHLAERRATGRVVQADGDRSMPEAAVDVARALKVLPRRQREAIVLHYWLQFSVSEIASLLSVSEGTVKTALHRGRERLSAQLAEQPEVTT